MSDPFPTSSEISNLFNSDINRKKRGMKIIRSFRASHGGKKCFYSDDFPGSSLSAHWTATATATVSGGICTIGPNATPSNISNSILNVSAATDIDWVVEGQFGQDGDQYFYTDANPHSDGARWVRSGSTILAVKLVNGTETTVASIASIPNLTTFRLRIETIGSTVNWYKRQIGTDADWVLVATDSFTWDGNGKKMTIGITDNDVATYLVDKIYQNTERILCP